MKTILLNYYYLQNEIRITIELNIAKIIAFKPLGYNLATCRIFLHEI